MSDTPIQRAVTAVGSQSALARLIGVTPQRVQQMVDTGRASHNRVIAIEKATGISRHELRPDLYPVT